MYIPLKNSLLTNESLKKIELPLIPRHFFLRCKKNNFIVAINSFLNLDVFAMSFRVFINFNFLIN